MDFLDTNTLITLGKDVGILALSLIVAKIVQVVLVKLLMHGMKILRVPLTDKAMHRIELPLLLVLMLLMVAAALPITSISGAWVDRLHMTLRLITVGCFGWLIAACAYAFGDYLEARFSLQVTAVTDAREILRARRLNTQVRVLRRIVLIFIVVLTVIGMALVIPGLRELGMSLFASAGVAGIVLGVAAKSTLSNIIAGAQLALTQPILLGDEVVIDKQGGIIEEINSSYVVVKMWDLRRLIVPLSHFMENSFENLTYQDLDMMGKVVLYTDYSVDIDALRAEAKKAVEESKLWDGKKFELLVSDTRETVLEIQVTISAKDSPSMGGLRNEVREKLVKYLQSKQATSLPQTHISLLKSRNVA